MKQNNIFNEHILVSSQSSVINNLSANIQTQNNIILINQNSKIKVYPKEISQKIGL